MSGENSGQSEQLNQIIAHYLKAVESGEAPDREELIERHPDFADDLKSFFADHDKMKELTEPMEPVAQAEEETPGSEARTIPPGAVESEALAAALNSQPISAADVASATDKVCAVEGTCMQPQRGDAPDWLRDPRLKSLDPRHVVVERIAGWIFVAVVAGVALVVLTGTIIASGPPGWGMGLVLGGILVVLASLAWFAHAWPTVTHRWCRYLASNEGLEIYRGVFWRSVVNVPRSRIQHTDVRQGPLQRRFGLGKLVVHTAGTQHAVIELDGLSREEALVLRDLLTAREDEDDAV
jgi:membrane protein YdbS with pleckstrin-like domain